MKKLLCVGFVSFSILTGCISPEQKKINQQRALAHSEMLRASIPICQNSDDCKAKWEAAQLWLVKNSYFKIRTITDTFIETYTSTSTSGSKRDDMELAYLVTKEPMGEGKYAIKVEIKCSSYLMCFEDRESKMLKFNKYVSSVQF